jgi:hypothetical protein
VPYSWHQSSQCLEMNILSPIERSKCLIHEVIVTRCRHLHTLTYKRFLVSDIWRKSSHGLQMYILSPTQRYQSLTSDVNRQSASTCTYFHLYHSLHHIRRQSSGGLNTYKLALTRDPQSWQLESKDTYTFFHLHKLCVGNMTSIVRRPRDVTTWWVYLHV